MGVEVVGHDGEEDTGMGGQCKGNASEEGNRSGDLHLGSGQSRVLTIPEPGRPDDRFSVEALAYVFDASEPE